MMSRAPDPLVDLDRRDELRAEGRRPLITVSVGVWVDRSVSAAL